MRKDMWKLFSEEVRRQACPVANGGVRNLQRTPADELPGRESLLTRWRGYYHEGCWNSKPLKGYLASRVGRDWDEVFSEICRHCSLNNYVQRRMRETLLSFVNLNIVMEGDKPRTSDDLPVFPGEFWVDPRSGKLCCVPHEEKQHYAGKKSKRLPQVAIDALHKYVQVNGCWFLVRFEPLPAKGGAYDVVLKPDLGDDRKKELPAYFYKSAWGAAIYAVDKRQISGNDIRKLKRAGILPG